MAKALLGHVGTVDPRVTARLTAENRALRQRVADLEAYAARLQAANDQLAAAAEATRRTVEDEALLPV